MAKTTLGLDSHGQSKQNSAAITEGDDEEEATDNRRDINAGPPGFYDADLTNYYNKFDKSLKERSEFKNRMKDKMSFTNTEWNLNTES